MTRTLFAKLAEQTGVAIVLRKIVELNFRKKRRRSVSNVNLSPDARIVDVGCGTREFARFSALKASFGWLSGTRPWLTR
jgi:2-polyprenyl-3-methyl-5-hydroxy-6-metoxy-1,4-benzoquinol methylase